jgi:hypothetical protein
MTADNSPRDSLAKSAASFHDRGVSEPCLAALFRSTSLAHLPTASSLEMEIVPNAFDTREATDQVRIHLVAAKMWAGKILEGLGNPFPAELADRAE